MFPVPFDIHNHIMMLLQAMFHTTYITQRFSQFLMLYVNKTSAKVQERVNREAGYALEMPCVFCLHGLKPYIDKIKELIDIIIIYC